MISDRDLSCDILVAGGGPAGVSCALAAARLGARVILCQDRPVLGGNASSEVRMHIVGATGLDGGRALETEIREGGIIEEIRLDLAVQNPQRSPSMLDLVLYDKCRREPHLTLLLNTTVVSAEIEGGRIARVRAERQSTEERFTIGAQIFIDCTGDGRLGVEAGAPFRHGREGRTEYGEENAPPSGDRKTLGSTLLFQARKHGRPMPFSAPPWARRFTAADFKFRPFGQPGSDLGLEYGYWWIEWGGCLDTIKDNEHIRDELLAIVLGVWHYVKNESEADASCWALEWFGFLPGKRESRRFIGQQVLAEGDLLSSRSFPDAIAFGGWPIDTHPPEGVDAPDLPPCEQRHLPFLYDIPLRACVSAGPANLMFAGRNISATHLAFASTRVMATCAVIGQGVGTAAALALRAGVPPAEIASRAGLMREIQQQLLKDDCFLIGLRNEDAADQVLTAAALSASSAQPGAGPDEIRSGQTRTIEGRAGRPARPGAPNAPALAPTLPSSPSLVSPAGRDAQPYLGADSAPCIPPDRTSPGLHRWMSDPSAGLPAWLEIRWARPVRLREIILIFDTGLHRLLTLSQADGYTRKMLWGRAQPETVRDYAIAIEVGQKWREVSAVQGNYQRRRVHRFDAPVETMALRLTVTATNGLDHARLLELRAY